MFWPHRLIIALLLIGVVACSGSGETPRGAATGPLINCHDEARQVVAKTFVNDCKGRIVSDDVADRIRSAGTPQTRKPTAYRIGAPLGRMVASGTGFFINAGGDMVTSEHVVDDCSHISVSPAAGGSQFARLVATDKPTDLALLKVPVQSPPFAQLAQNLGPALEKGVIVIGYPSGSTLGARPKPFGASLLGYKKATRGLTVIGFQGKVQHGQSGGPLIDPNANVIGVVFAKRQSAKGSRQKEIGFAVPVDVVAAFLQRNGSTFTVNAAGSAGEVADPLVTARQFVARVGCWR